MDMANFEVVRFGILGPEERAQEDLEKRSCPPES